jgi:hypothetical protein
VLWVAHARASAGDLLEHVTHVDPSGLAVETEPQGPVTGPSASACVLDGVLDPNDGPGRVLAWAYRRLSPGGELVLRVKDGQFPGETLQALLFREGFEEPARRSHGADLLVTARRSELAPPLQRRQRLSVIMPAFNEVATFETTMNLVLAKEIAGIDIEVIVVESNSTDGTREKVLSYANHPRVRVILEERPQGKGHAVRTGLAAARGDFLLIQDADMEYDIDDYDVLLEPLRAAEVGFVLGMRTSPEGSRGLRDFGQLGLTSRVMNVGHVLFLTLFNTVYGQRLKDPFTMYKVMRRDCLHGLVFECNRFDFDWELTAKLVRAGYRPREIPVTYRSRSFSEGKKVSFLKDPLTWVRACFKYRFAELYPQMTAALNRPGAHPQAGSPSAWRTTGHGAVELVVDPPEPSEAGVAAKPLTEGRFLPRVPPGADESSRDSLGVIG